MTTVHVSGRAGGNNDELFQMLDRMEIEDFLSFHAVDYRVARGRSGTQLNLRECPRCHGTDWKVYLNADTGLGNCFHGSCVGEPGYNKFSYIYNLFDKNYRDTLNAIEAYGRTVGWRPVTRKERLKDEPISEVTLPDSIPLPFNGKTLKYLDERGFLAETVKYFGFRFSQKGHFDFSLAGQARRQDYSRRVIIPIYDLTGKLVTFQGRAIDKDVEKKYLFPPGLPGAGRYLYNGQHAVGKRRIVIGEGALDVAAIKQSFDQDEDFKDVIPVGSFGKSLSMSESSEQNDQLSDLLRLKELGLQEITMMWDGEVSTIKAAIDVALQLKGYGFVTRVATLPLNKDPNEVPSPIVRQVFNQATVITTMTAAKLLSKYCFHSK